MLEKVKKPRRNVRLVGTAIGLAIAIAAAWLGTHSRKAGTPDYPILAFATAKPVLDALPKELPPELRQSDESKWKAWAQREDERIRARLEQGALDSMIN